MGLSNCWEIKKCERQEGGAKVLELGQIGAQGKEVGKLFPAEQRKYGDLVMNRMKKVS